MENDVNSVITTLLNALIGLGVFISGAALTAVNFALQDAPIDFVSKNLLGPMGLLVGALVTVWWLVKYLKHLTVKMERTIELRLAEKDALIKEKSERISDLERRLYEKNTEKKS